MSKKEFSTTAGTSPGLEIFVRSRNCQWSAQKARGNRKAALHRLSAQQAPLVTRFKTDHGPPIEFTVLILLTEATKRPN